MVQVLVLPWTTRPPTLFLEYTTPAHLLIKHNTAHYTPHHTKPITCDWLKVPAPVPALVPARVPVRRPIRPHRSEEHTSELQSRDSISYAVFSEGGSAIGLDFSTSVALDANWRVWWMVHQPPRFGVYPVDFSGPAHFAISAKALVKSHPHRSHSLHSIPKQPSRLKIHLASTVPVMAPESYSTGVYHILAVAKQAKFSIN